MKKYWFYLESYVHLAARDKGFLLYNPLNGASYQCSRRLPVARILDEIRHEESSGICEVTEADRENQEFRDLLRHIQAGYMGDLLDQKWSAEKPFQILNQVRVMNEIAKPSSAQALVGGDGLLSYLTTLTLHLNQSRRLSPLFANGYRQFLFPAHLGREYESLPCNLVQKIISETRHSSLRCLNLLGGEIFKYPDLSSLIRILNIEPYQKALFLFYSDLPSHLESISRLDLKFEPGPNTVAGWEINLLAFPPFRSDRIHQSILLAAQLDIPVCHHFIVEDDSSLTAAQAIIDRHELAGCVVQPFFNGENKQFFLENVYLNRQNILEGCPSQRDIFARGVLNQNHFGRLTVLSNGDYYANVNEQPLGNVSSASIHQVIFKELSERSCWLGSRIRKTPCDKCLFNCLCPSTSNYEYVLGRNNLCDIRQSGKDGESSAGGSGELAKKFPL